MNVQGDARVVIRRLIERGGQGGSCAGGFRWWMAGWRWIDSKSWDQHLCEDPSSTRRHAQSRYGVLTSSNKKQPGHRKRDSPPTTALDQRAMSHNATHGPKGLSVAEALVSLPYVRIINTSKSGATSAHRSMGRTQAQRQPTTLQAQHSSHHDDVCVERNREPPDKSGLVHSCPPEIGQY